MAEAIRLEPVSYGRKAAGQFCGRVAACPGGRRDKDRLEEYRRVAVFNRYCRVDVHEISPCEVRDLFPLAKVDDIEAGFYVKEVAASILSMSRWRSARALACGACRFLRECTQAEF